MGLSENKVPPTPIIYHQCPYWHSHLQGVPHFQTHPNHIKSYQIISNHTITIYKPGISRNYVPFFLNLRQHLSVHGAVKSRLKLPISSMGYDENFYTHLDWRIWIWIWRIWMMNLCVCIYICIYIYMYIHTLWVYWQIWFWYMGNGHFRALRSQRKTHECLGRRSQRWPVRSMS